jgi:hypothetical protein
MLLQRSKSGGQVLFVLTSNIQNLKLAGSVGPVHTVPDFGQKKRLAH